MTSSLKFRQTYYGKAPPDTDTMEQEWRDLKHYRTWVASRLNNVMELCESVEERKRIQIIMKDVTGFSVGIIEGGSVDEKST